MDEIQKTIGKLSPIEKKIVPYLGKSLKEIEKKSGLDKTSVLRALKFLENKGLVKVNSVSKSIIDLGTNGIYYKKNQLPERKLLETIEKNNHLKIQDAKKQSRLSDNEFKVSLGVLKSKSMVEIKDGKIVLTASKNEISKKTLEEQVLELLPKEESEINDELKQGFESLKKRKEIIEIKQKTDVSFEVTELGKKISGKKIESDLLEEVTPEIIKNWGKGKKFRAYDINAGVPKVYGGRKHFVNQAVEYGKRVWLDLGFKEVTGSKVQTSFWVFDSLFTAQDHPVREMQDTFFLKDLKGNLPDEEIVKKVKEAHESGVDGSRGWRYVWSEDDAKKVVLRTHTTCLSAQALANLDLEKDLPLKLFSIGKVFRNETVDWSHGFEFYQSEGIVVDKNANFRELLGYLREFYNKMGYDNVRFTPAYFPYTEPSVEIHVYHPEKKVWLELGGAGIFRPEVTVPLLKSKVPVLAWGQGFDRIIMDYYKIKDLRELYANNLNDLRNKMEWVK